MTTAQKLLRLTIILFVVVTVFSYIQWLLGYKGFLLTGEIEIPNFLVYGISFIVLSVNTILSIALILNIYNKKVIYISTPLLFLFVIFSFLFGNTVITTILLPMIYTLVLAKIIKDFRSNLIRFFKYYSIIIAYQLVSLFIKFGAFMLWKQSFNVYQALVYSIDYLIFMSILFCSGGIKHYGMAISAKLVFFPQGVESPKRDMEDLQAENNFLSLTGWRRIGAIVTLVGFQILQWTIILAVCRLGNVFYEGLIISGSFIAYGFIIRYRWHSSSVIICTLMSTLLFYVSAKACIPFVYSQFLPVLIGLLCIYSLYRVAIYSDEHGDMRKQLATPKKMFRCKTATEEEIRARCIELGKKDDYINFMLLAYRSGKTRKEIAKEFFISESTVKKYKHDRTIELERFN